MDKNCDQKFNYVTDIEVKNYIFDWELKNYGPHYRKFFVDSRLYSPFIKFNDDVDLEWGLDIYGRIGNEKDYITLCLYNGCTKLKIIHVTLSLLTSSQDLVDFRQKQLDINTKPKHILSVPVKSKLFELKEGGSSSSSNTLIVRFEATYYDYISKPIRSLYNKKSMLPEFNAFEKLFDNEKFSDAQVIVGDRVFNVHKCILNGRIVLYSNDMKEITESRVKILDTSPEVMQEVLRFIYTGKVNNMDALKTDLFIAAEKYEVKDLKILCEEALIQDLNVENVVSTTLFAHSHNANTLKAVAEKFLTIYKKEIISTKNFAIPSEIMSPTILATFKPLFD